MNTLRNSQSLPSQTPSFFFKVFVFCFSNISLFLREIILELPLFSFRLPHLPLVFVVMDHNSVGTSPFNDLITTYRWETTSVSDFFHCIGLSKYFPWCFCFLLVVYETSARTDSRESPASSASRVVSVRCAISLPLTMWLTLWHSNNQVVVFSLLFLIFFYLIPFLVDNVLRWNLFGT